MQATSAKNAAKKFIIEADFYIVKTHRPEREFLKGNLTAWAGLRRLNLHTGLTLKYCEYRLFLTFHGL